MHWLVLILRVLDLLIDEVVVIFVLSDLQLLQDVGFFSEICHIEFDCNFL